MAPRSCTTSSTARCRPTARWATPPTCRSRRCTATRAPRGSTTAPTRSIAPRWQGRCCAATRRRPTEFPPSTCRPAGRRPGASSQSCWTRSRQTTRSGAPTLVQVMGAVPEKLLLAAPRGYCAGVDRAVQTVERALELYGAPVYVRKEIVHNKHVVEELRDRGAIFVETETDVPEGATVVFSAHGVAPGVHVGAAERRLRTIDATCPLVTKVHVEAKKFAAQGYTIGLIGHAGHEEVEGTMGEAPDQIVLVQDEDEVDRLEVADPSRMAYISQTTLSVDETRAIILRLRERFPQIVGPRTDDSCYAP